jgi:hypothetical protein
MVLDEWHLEVYLSSDVSAPDAERIRATVTTLLDEFGEQLEEKVRQATGIAGVTVTISQ